MGRGRDNGPVDQSTKKPKVRKNKERGDNWVLFKPNSIEENTELPILVSEELLAEMQKMSSQELMNILLPDNANNVSLTSEKKNCQLTDAIQILPPELREKIYKEFIKIKLWQRKMLGWDDVRKEISKGYIKMKLKQRKTLGWGEVHAAIKEAPVCFRNKQIVRVLFCYKCGGSRCSRNGLCNLCIRNGFRHYLGYPIYDENDYDECFKKSFYAEPLRDPFLRKTGNQYFSSRSGGFPVLGTGKQRGCKTENTTRV